jgi:hypothetical protein
MKQNPTDVTGQKYILTFSLTIATDQKDKGKDRLFGSKI